MNQSPAFAAADVRPYARSPSRIWRPHLTERIREAMSYGIALMTAPAGFGKSEALRQCFDEDSAYLIELDDRASTVEAFLRELVTRTSRRNVRGLASLLERTPAEAVRDTVVPWVAGRLRAVDRAIVIDNLQVLFADRRAAAALQALIEATRHSVTWVLSSRETPQFPVGTWIARQWMHTPLTAADLAFREHDVRVLADVLRVDLPDDEIARLVHATDGWPVALQLSLSNWKRTGTHAPAGMRSREVLYAYIDEQVWSQLTPARRELLEHAALLPRIRLSVLSAAGFRNAGTDLEHIARDLPFIDRSEDGEFRVHDVVRKYVNARHRLAPERHRTAVARIAGALSELGMTVEALRLFITLEDPEPILAILARHGYALIDGGDRATVADAVAVLPSELRNHPIAAAMRGWLHMLDGSFTNAEADMRRALTCDVQAFAISAGQRLTMFCLNRGRFAEALQLAGDLLGREGLERVEAIDLYSALAAIHGEMGGLEDALRYAELAVAGISELPVERRPRVLARVAGAYFRSGRYDEAERLCNEAASLAGELGLDIVAAMAYSVLHSIAENAHPDTTKADFYARAMGTAAGNAGDRMLRMASLERLLYTATVRGDDQAVAAIERELSGQGQMRLLRDNVQSRVGKVIREVGMGRYRQAMRVLETMDDRELSHAEKALRLSLYAVVCFGNRDITGAVSVLDAPAIAHLETDVTSRKTAALAQMYRKFALWLIGRVTVARRTVLPHEDALTESDRALARVIDEICALGHREASPAAVKGATEPLLALGLGGHARFLTNLAGSSQVEVQLTRAELAILRSWRVGDTIGALAERLGKSTHTVNTHMGSIYRKTGSGNRAEALEFARHHGLLN